MADKETAVEYINKERATFCSNEKRWINKIHKLAEKTGEVTIVKEPFENEGFILAEIPQKWLRISPPHKVSPEAADRLKSFKNTRKTEENQEKNGEGANA